MSAKSTKHRNETHTPNKGESFVLEGFENELAILERLDGTILELPRHWLPDGLNEGDHIQVTAQNGTVQFQFDHQATEQARAHISQLRHQIRTNSDDDGKDVEL